MLPLWSVAKTRSTAGSTSVSTVAPPRAKHIGAPSTNALIPPPRRAPLSLARRARAPSRGAAQLCASVATIGASQRELVDAHAQLAAALARLAPPPSLGVAPGGLGRPVTPLSTPPAQGAPLGARPRDLEA